MKEMVGGCCVCSDERGWPDNPLVYCDGNGCTVAVHQACYGIVTVPTGPWFCRKCENPDTKSKVRCELCPSKSGALKLSDTGGWAHVVCALYIPEVRFGNVTSMEPIVLRLIPQERYNKICYICQDQGKSRRANAGACMQCNKSGCKQQFHVTCAQSLGLLCEEAGNYLDNVKYCGYCKLHYSKLKKTGNVKTIPPYKPVSHDSQSSDSSGDKDGEASPLVSGSGTPTHALKPKASGRKSSHSNSSSTGKYTPVGSKTPTSNNQPLSSSRRQSLEDPKKLSNSGKTTSVPSPQDNSTDTSQTAKSLNNSTPGLRSKTTSPVPSPSESNKSQESVGVISSLSSVTASATPTLSTFTATSVVQTTNSVKPYQESVITNAESIDNKQTKKRKAAAAAASAATGDIASTPSPSSVATEGNSLDNTDPISTDIQMEPVVKIVKKSKTPGSDNGSYPNASPVPTSQPSPRHLISPSVMPGPSEMNNMSNIRSPSEKSNRERDSLVISVPLPSISQGLNLTTHQQPGPTNDHQTSPHIFHQVQKQASMEQSVSPLSLSHSMSGQLRWGGLKVSHEMQKVDMTKAGMSGMSSMRDAGNNSAMRNKKRVVTSHTTTSSLQIASAQSLASKMLPSQPTPPPMYTENLNDSSSTSSGSEKPIYPKVENSMDDTLPQLISKSEREVTAHLEGHLNAELGGSPAPGQNVPPPLFNRATQDASRGGRSSVSSAQGLDQLLERQWEQGSQFLMEQAEHFDIASLLSCLHQLRTDNVRLEEHVNSLLQRRDHLLAVNARLAIPLTTAAPTDPNRSGSENGAQIRGPMPYDRKQ